MNNVEFKYLSNLSSKEEHYLAFRTESLMGNLGPFLEEIDDLTEHRVNPILKERLNSIQDELESYYGYKPHEMDFNLNGIKKCNKIQSIIINQYPEKFYIPVNGSLYKQN